MWWPLRNQILVPFAALLFAAVALTSVSSAYLAARRSGQATVAQLNRVIETLGESNFPFSQTVLERMRGLSGAEFVAYGPDDRTLASTLTRPVQRDQQSRVARSTAVQSLDQHPAIRHAGQSYYAASLPVRSPGRVTSLLVLYPERSLKQAQWDAAMPSLVIGGMTMLLTALVSAWLAHRMSRRIRLVHRQVAAIEAGDFLRLDVGGRRDEIQDLAAGVNRMSEQLQQMQHTIRQTERTRLLGQLAGGLAHQLRNAITGARMAVQIHQRRCPTAADSESLRVALRQLSLTEEQVKGLLSLGKPERHAPVPCPLHDLIEDIAALVSPACKHADVTFQHETTGDSVGLVSDSEAVRTAVLNLTLNAIEAAGAGGQVRLAGHADRRRLRFVVSDTGPGPPEEIADQLFEVFVTSKPEGVGFGLALARQVADEGGGQLAWNRDDGWTRFELILPTRPCESQSATAAPDLFTHDLTACPTS